MSPIELLYTKNNIRRRNGKLQQELAFCISILDQAFKKQLLVIWTGESGHWQALEASYYCKSGEGREIWIAQTLLEQRPEQQLPGKVKFSIRYAVDGKEYLDDNHGQGYISDAGCGILLREGMQVQNLLLHNLHIRNPQVEELGSAAQLGRFQDIFPVSAAVRMEAQAQQVIIHWTTDGWKTCYSTSCRFRGMHGKKTHNNSLENDTPASAPEDFPAKRGRGHVVVPGRGPNPSMIRDPEVALATGPGIWTGYLPVQDAFALEYAIAVRTPNGLLWDNNKGLNYRAQRRTLKVLTLNLHCYQEQNQEEKFKRIASVINRLDIDLICLQEVGEHWKGGIGDWHSNAAKIISDHLQKPYHIYTDWSHIGFKQYREGSAILSRFPFLMTDSRYVSSDADPQSIHSRKVCMARVHVPGMGTLNLFCVHLSWWEDGFREQFETLNAWAERSQKAGGTTLFCGDFNVNVGSEGYYFATDLYDDQIAIAHKGACACAAHNLEKLSGSPSNEHSPADDERIDYVLMRKGSHLKAVASRALFTDADFGRVSDHCAYLVEFEPA